MKKQKQPYSFTGFHNTGYTPVPNEFFDELLPFMGEAELKACLYSIRRTFGFQRHEDKIAYSQFTGGITKKDGTVLDRGCGVSNPRCLSKAMRSLSDMRILNIRKAKAEAGDKETNVYGLNFLEPVYFAREKHQENTVLVPLPQKGTVLGTVPLDQPVESGEEEGRVRSTVPLKENSERGTVPNTGGGTVPSTVTITKSNQYISKSNYCVDATAQSEMLPDGNANNPLFEEMETLKKEIVFLQGIIEKLQRKEEAPLQVPSQESVSSSEQKDGHTDRPVCDPRGVQEAEEALPGVDGGSDVSSIEDSETHPTAIEASGDTVEMKQEDTPAPIASKPTKRRKSLRELSGEPSQKEKKESAIAKKARRAKIYECIQEFKQKTWNDPEHVEMANTRADEAANTLLDCNGTAEMLTAVMQDMWDEQDTDGKHYWRDNRRKWSVAAIVAQYSKRAPAIREKRLKEQAAQKRAEEWAKQQQNKPREITRPTNSYQPVTKAQQEESHRRYEYTHPRSWQTPPEVVKELGEKYDREKQEREAAAIAQ